MLMTPMTPKVMARPIAASSSTEPSERPYQAFCTIDHSARLLWIEAIAAAAALATSWRLAGRQAGQQRHGFLVAARLDDGDGLELVDLGGVRLEQQDRRARFGESGLRGLVGFLGQRFVDDGQRVLVMRLEHGLRGRDALGGIRRQQGEAAERGLDRAAQAVVEPHVGNVVGQLVDGSAGRGVDDLVVRLLDEDLLRRGIGDELAVLQRADDGKGERIAGRRDRIDRVFGVGEVVVGEFGDGVLERTREGRPCERHDQEQQNANRAKAVKKIGGHWTTPAGVVEKAATLPPSPVS